MEHETAALALLRGLERRRPCGPAGLVHKALLKGECKPGVARAGLSSPSGEVLGVALSIVDGVAFVSS